MASVNKVILVGNCGRDPEIRYLPSGQAVANVSVATSSRRKDKNSGETIEDTQWHRVTFYDRLAEIAGEYVKKGRPIYVEGRLKYGTYVDKATGVEKNTVDIIATELQLLGGREGMGGGDEGGGGRWLQAARPLRPRAVHASKRGSPASTSSGPKVCGAGRRQALSSGFDDMDDDIPFRCGLDEASPHQISWILAVNVKRPKTAVDSFGPFFLLTHFLRTRLRFSYQLPCGFVNMD